MTALSQTDILPTTLILERASKAIGTVDRHGRRGVTLLSVDQIEAMALVLALLGLHPTYQGEPAPQMFFTPVKEPLNEH